MQQEIQQHNLNLRTATEGGFGAGPTIDFGLPNLDFRNRREITRNRENTPTTTGNLLLTLTGRVLKVYQNVTERAGTVLAFYRDRAASHGQSIAVGLSEVALQTAATVGLDTHLRQAVRSLRVWHASRMAHVDAVGYLKEIHKLKADQIRNGEDPSIVASWGYDFTRQYFFATREARMMGMDEEQARAVAWEQVRTTIEQRHRAQVTAETQIYTTSPEAIQAEIDRTIANAVGNYLLEQEQATNFQVYKDVMKKDKVLVVTEELAANPALLTQLITEARTGDKAIPIMADATLDETQPFVADAVRSALEALGLDMAEYSAQNHTGIDATVQSHQMDGLTATDARMVTKLNRDAIHNLAVAIDHTRETLRLTAESRNLPIAQKIEIITEVLLAAGVTEEVVQEILLIAEQGRVGTLQDRELAMQRVAEAAGDAIHAVNLVSGEMGIRLAQMISEITSISPRHAEVRIALRAFWKTAGVLRVRWHPAMGALYGCLGSMGNLGGMVTGGIMGMPNPYQNPEAYPNKWADIIDHFYFILPVTLLYTGIATVAETAYKVNDGSALLQSFWGAFQRWTVFFGAASLLMQGSNIYPRLGLPGLSITFQESKEEWFTKTIGRVWPFKIITAIAEAIPPMFEDIGFGWDAFLFNLRRRAKGDEFKSANANFNFWVGNATVPTKSAGGRTGSYTPVDRYMGLPGNGQYDNSGAYAARPGAPVTPTNPRGDAVQVQVGTYKVGLDNPDTVVIWRFGGGYRRVPGLSTWWESHKHIEQPWQHGSHDNRAGAEGYEVPWRQRISTALVRFTITLNPFVRIAPVYIQTTEPSHIPQGGPANRSGFREVERDPIRIFMDLNLSLWMLTLTTGLINAIRPIRQFHEGALEIITSTSWIGRWFGDYLGSAGTAVAKTLWGAWNWVYHVPLGIMLRAILQNDTLLEAGNYSAYPITMIIKTAIERIGEGTFFTDLKHEDPFPYQVDTPPNGGLPSTGGSTDLGLPDRYQAYHKGRQTTLTAAAECAIATFAGDNDLNPATIDVLPFYVGECDLHFAVVQSSLNIGDGRMPPDNQVLGILEAHIEDFSCIRGKSYQSVKDACDY